MNVPLDIFALLWNVVKNCLPSIGTVKTTHLTSQSSSACLFTLYQEEEAKNCQKTVQKRVRCFKIYIGLMNLDRGMRFTTMWNIYVARIPRTFSELSHSSKNSYQNLKTYFSITLLGILTEWSAKTSFHALSHGRDCREAM